MTMWSERAMPLLLAIREAQDDFDIVEGQQGPRPEYLADKVGLDEFTVRSTLVDLWDGGLITGARMDSNDTIGFYATAIRLTPDGLRAVNEWPSAEGTFDALVAILTDMADAEANPERRKVLRRMLDGAKALPRELAVEIGGAYLARISGIG